MHIAALFKFLGNKTYEEVDKNNKLVLLASLYKLYFSFSKFVSNFKFGGNLPPL